MTRQFCAFDETRALVEGDLLTVALAVKSHADSQPGRPVQIFDKQSGQVVDVLLEGGADDIATWIRENIADALPALNKTRGRPKLGVVSREITLLPRQWAWLNDQRGGASVTLRRLVDEATKDPRAERRTAQDATYRFATAIARDAPGFEEAMRALYAGRADEFSAAIQAWPADVKAHATRLASGAWA